ncbi:MAG: thioredoxin domain-containing protein [Rhodobacteraceae bacterium]|nr:thioredoxin domain-containing protein [Paracoccaceae bacterium]
MIQLDIFSDPVCPWCYIGKTYLDRALEAAPNHPFAVEWHPFQLNPDMPAAGMDRADYLAAKFGGRDRAAQIYDRIAQAARVAGIEIDFDRIDRIPNTLDAHRLIHWAGLEGRQTPAVAALFRAYWREGRDIGDADVLTDIAASLGLDREVIARLLAGDADREAMAARDAHARARGVTAVPTFIVGGQYALPGAQPVALWAEVIAEIAASQG